MEMHQVDGSELRVLIIFAYKVVPEEEFFKEIAQEIIHFGDGIEKETLLKSKVEMVNVLISSIGERIMEPIYMPIIEIMETIKNSPRSTLEMAIS